MRVLTKAICGVAVATLAASGALAETLPVRGVFASRVILPADIETIATEQFGGDLGPDAAIMLTDELGGVTFDGEPFYRVMPASMRSGQVIVVDRTGDNIQVSDPNAPDAVFRGSVRSEFERVRVDPKIVEECVERDDRKKCVKYEDVEVPCSELRVRVMPRLLLIDPTGRQLYSYDQRKYAAEKYCRDQEERPSQYAIADRLTLQAVQDIRRDLIPFQAQDWVRVMESRKNLRKEDRDAFKDAVKLTKNNRHLACDAFQRLANSNPEHLSSQFNLGLCYEMYQQWDAAREMYNISLAIDDHDYPKRGLNRIARKERGARQLEERGF